MSGPRRPIDVFLQPGEYFVGNADYRIRTLLGSCVSITLWQGRRVGAMSHFLLSGREPDPFRELDGRYGEEALSLMLRQLHCAGITPEQCEGKIFDGAEMFPLLSTRYALHVGRQNGKAARRLLGQHGVRVSSESLFGVGHRQIIFDVGSGAVWARQVEPVEVCA